MTAVEASVKLENVTKKYEIRGRTYFALSNVNLSFKPSEFSVIIGPTGSGKTTLLNIIAGVEKPDQGKVYVDGVNILGVAEEEVVRLRRDKIGYITQTFTLVPDFNVLENLELPLLIKRVPREAWDDLIWEVTSKLEILHLKFKKPSELSSGEQRKVMIARALVTNPKILLADEPTNDIDVKTTVKIIKLFHQLKEERGTTIIVTTHDPLFLKYADKIVYLRDGYVIRVKQRHGSS